MATSKWQEKKRQTDTSWLIQMCEHCLDADFNQSQKNMSETMRESKH
jgi:hypothetical protein